MSPAWGWTLAVLAMVAGYGGYGWRGVALALTVVAFWLLLQFSRAMRALRTAAGRPVGEMPNAVMLNARLAHGMRMPQVLRLTRSLGRPVGTAGPGPAPVAHTAAGDEAYVWTDPGGDAVRVDLRSGRVVGWQLLRAGT